MTVDAALAEAHRDEWARVVAAVARRTGSIDVAEEAAAAAFAAAVARWPSDGVPRNPGAWLTTTAHRNAVDWLRREAKRDQKYREALMLTSAPEPVGAIEDDRLRLMFTCCHPALAMEARIALTLRLVAGLTASEIAHAFLVQPVAMERRLGRAKAKIRDAGIPYRVPDREDLPARAAGVLAVLYLVFNEGYLASNPEEDPVRADLTAEAIRLARLVCELMPDDGEAAGLLALMLFTDARRPARVSPDGELVPLGEQNRGLWDRGLIAEGQAILRRRLASGQAPGRYQLLAAIGAVHTQARDVQDTDWAQIVTLYDQLARQDPSPIVRLNRAIAVAEVDGADVALAALDELPLDTYHPFHAARADVLRRLGRNAEARAAYDRAIGLSRNSAEVAYLARRRDELRG